MENKESSDKKYELLRMPKIEIILPEMKYSTRGAPSWQEDYLIPTPKLQRLFWPPYKIEFKLETDIGAFSTYVTGASALAGDPWAGHYITKNMRYWFRNHLELEVGSILQAKKLGHLIYRLDILDIPPEQNS